MKAMVFAATGFTTHASRFRPKIQLLFGLAFSPAGLYHAPGSEWRHEIQMHCDWSGHRTVLYSDKFL